MSNIRNFGSLTGRLANDPKIFINSDGSKKVLMTLMVDRGYVDRNTNQRPSDAIDVEAFVNKTANGNGPFGSIHKGDRVQFATELRKDVYQKNGQTVYEQKVIVTDVDFLEPKSVTDARLAERVAKAEAQNQHLSSQASEPAPAATAAAPVAVTSAVGNDEQLPFG